MPFALLSACASQNDLSYVQGQVSQLKQESQTIKQQSAGSYSEMTQYREDIARLRGSINELQYNYQSAIKRLDMEDSLQVSKSNDLENRIARIEKYIGLEAPVTRKSVPAVKPAPVQPSTSSSKTVASKPRPEKAAMSENLLSEGLLLMEKKDYNSARERFKEFMSKNPDSPKVSDAQFYLAESYYEEQWYEKAILEYQVVIAKYTKSAKRPAALYKQGLAFEQIGDKANARARYRDVVNLYSKTPEARLAKKKLAEK